MVLMRFDPFRDFDRLLNDVWGDNQRRAFRSMAMDAYRDGDHFMVHFDLPGVDPESIEVTVEDNVLNVKAERSWERREGQDWVANERYEGTFQRQLFLGDTLDAEGIEANYENGVLTLTVPVAEKAKPRKIEISKGEGDKAKAIDATSHAA